MSSFALIHEAKVNGTVPVFKYKSADSGLTLVLANVEGPVVNGYFCLATEAMDDDGLPHTLEHLIFLGSELYPYKGVLDMLANRCLASGTNAWTDVDHTCYTMTTAGKDGFLELMPIYLDHILYPTLSDAGFITEVHHVSESGEDGGVVYSEMQGRENTGESRAHLQLLRAAYKNCGYSSETGGILQNLRTSTTNEKVRHYHKEFYRPENLTIIIAGQVTIDEVAKSLESVEAKIRTKHSKSTFARPWQTAIPELNESQNIKILYPSDEEDTGLVSIGWRGPKCTTENLKLTACSILMRYLSDTSVSPLHREFVEIADPFASHVSFNIFENSESFIYFSFENVPIEKIDRIFDKLQAVLQKIADGDEKIDMARLYNILDRSILEYLNNLETNPHDGIAFLSIADVLYGQTVEDFEMRLNVNKQLEVLQTKDHSFWIDLLKEYIINGKYIVVRAAPSIEEQQQMSRAEAERIKIQRKVLGDVGLQEKGAALEEAMKINSIPPPENMLTKVPIPTVKGIQFHPVKIYRCGESEKAAGLDLDTIPVYAEAYDIHTNFVYFIITMDTESVPMELRPYLILLLELITVCPVRRGDKLLPYEEVVAELEKDTIQMGTHMGLESASEFRCGPFSHTASLMLQVERKKYNRGIEWIVDLLHNTEFTADRIRVCAAKMVNSISQAKRKGNSIVHDLLKTMYYAEDSNVRVSSILRQQKFLNSILEKLNDQNETASIICNLNCLRNTITLAKNVAIHAAASWEQMAETEMDLNTEWLKLLKVGDAPCKQQYEVVPDWAKMAPMQNVKQGTIVGLGCVDSAFLYHAAPSINSFVDLALADLLVFLQYLTQLEGPLWRQIRGQGLAYGYNIMPQPQEGLIYLTLYKCSNVVAAFKEAKAIIEAQLQPNAVWEPTLLESAKGSLIFEIIEREKSIGNLVVQSLLSNFKKVPINYNKMLIQRVNEVTIDDLVSVGQKYLSLLFAPEAKTAIVCHPDKVSEVAAEFLLLDRDLTVETSLENSVLGDKYSLN